MKILNTKLQNTKMELKKIEKMTPTSLKDFCLKEPIKKIKDIKLILDDLYYNTENSSMPDNLYDIIKDTIMYRDPNYVPEIGAKIRTNENRVNIPFWLGSADKITIERQGKLDIWLEKNDTKEYCISDKLDGVSGLLVVKGGTKKLYTRGDGVIGADISYLIQYFDSIPENIPDGGYRGELIMKTKTFSDLYSIHSSEEVKEKRKYKSYKNSRNMVAGQICAKTVRKGLSDTMFVVYEIIGTHEMPKQSDQLKELKRIGFTVVNHIKGVKEISMDTLLSYHEKLKSSSDYDIDGIVVQSDVKYDRNTTGNPSYMFAFKDRGDSNQAVTEVLDIEWQVSRHGKLVPVALVEHVYICNSTISRVTVHNAKNLIDKKIGPGAMITVTRSQDVIPFIVDVQVESENLKMPSENPDDYKWDENKVNFVTTKTSDQDLMKIKLIASFFEKLNIKFVSRATVTKMYNHGMDDLIKIIEATEKDLLEINGIKEKSAQRIVKNIHEGLQNITIPLIIGSSGVLGESIGRKRTDALFTDLPNVLEMSSSEELKNKILTIEGFSEITADKIVERMKYAKSLLEKISKYCTFKKEVRVSNSMVGKKYVMSGFRDKKLEQYIIERGG